MSYLINSNMLIKINKENEELRTAVNAYLEDIRDFDDYNAKVIGSDNQCLYINAGFYDEVHDEKFDSEDKLFDAVEKCNDGSFVVNMSATDCYGSFIKHFGNVKFVKVKFDDITSELNWIKETRPQFTLKTQKDSADEISKMFAKELSKIFDNADVFDQYEEDDNIVFVYDVDNWRSFSKTTISDFENRVKQIYDFAQSKNLNVSADFNELLISEDCSSYIEMFIDDNGHVNTSVYMISE